MRFSARVRDGAVADANLGSVRKISAEYGLDTRTHLGVKVTSVKRDPASSKDPHKHGCVACAS